MFFQNIHLFNLWDFESLSVILVLDCTWINAQVVFSGELLSNILIKADVNAIGERKVLV